MLGGWQEGKGTRQPLKWNQMTALRSMTGGAIRHPRPPFRVKSEQNTSHQSTSNNLAHTSGHNTVTSRHTHPRHTGHNRRKSQYLHFIYLQLITNTLRGVHQAYSKRLKGGGSFFLTCENFGRIFHHSFYACAFIFLIGD